MSYNYKITASHLNAFQRMLDAEVDAEGFANMTSDGEYKKTADEIYAEREMALLDLINRVPREPNEAADRGTAFNEIVDCLVESRGTMREDLSLNVVFVGSDGTIYENGDNRPMMCKKAIRAQINGFTFIFDIDLCKNAAKYFKGCICQHYVSAGIQTAYGDVLLYGYADYVGNNSVADLKTTVKYNFGKYEHGWQRYVYPYCLETSGDMQVREFSYEVRVLSIRKGVISGSSYVESYLWCYDKDKEVLRAMCERFIEWLEKNRAKITDKKIFGA